MSRSTMFLISVVGLAVSAAVLIMLIPSSFDSGGGPGTWLIGSLAVLVAICGVGTRRLRPPTSQGNR